MKGITLYAKGISHTFETLFKGKFLLFFIPGVVAGILLAMYFAQTQGIRDLASSTEDIPLIGGVIYWFVGSIGAFIDWIVEMIFQFVVLVCFSPFNCILAEKYDNYITGNKFDGGFLRIVNDMLRAIFIVFISLSLELLVSGLWWVLSFIFPPLDVLSPVVSFIIPAFFIGFSLYDYALERYGIGTFGTIGYGFKRMFLMVLGGGIFILILKIPYIGIILAPVLATMITTYVYVHRENKVQIINPDLLVDEQTVQEIEE
jgi:CysZ protein